MTKIFPFGTPERAGGVDAGDAEASEPAEMDGTADIGEIAGGRRPLGQRTTAKVFLVQ